MARAKPAPKKPAPKTTAPRKAEKREVQVIRPFKEALTKAALINSIAEQDEPPRKTAAAAFASLENLILGSLHPRGVGEFTSPGMFKVAIRKVLVEVARSYTIRDRRDGQGRSKACEHPSES
jgi:hypothetical protein